MFLSIPPPTLLVSLYWVEKRGFASAVLMSALVLAYVSIQIRPRSKEQRSGPCWIYHDCYTLGVIDNRTVDSSGLEYKLHFYPQSPVVHCDTQSHTVFALGKKSCQFSVGSTVSVLTPSCFHVCLAVLDSSKMFRCFGAGLLHCFRLWSVESFQPLADVEKKSGWNATASL